MGNFGPNMRILALLLLLPVAAFGRIEEMRWGVRAGVDVPHYAAAGWRMSNQAGWQVGLESRMWWRDWGLGAELTYHRHGLRADGTFVRIQTIDVPLIFSYRVHPVVRLEAGPVINLYNNARAKETFFTPLRPTLSYTFGAAVDISRRAWVELRWWSYFTARRGMAPGLPRRELNVWMGALTASVGVSF